MKKFVIPTVIAAFFTALAAVSCILPEEEKGNFWATNFVSDTYYKVDAELIASNELCEVWVEKNKGVTAEQAERVAQEYKNVVYAKLMAVLGWNKVITLTGDDGVNVSMTMNTMQWADYLGDNNGKLTILLLDIKDGYTNENGMYVAGYFDPYNYFSDYLVQTQVGGRSNECDMIYMDINPVNIDNPAWEFFGTLAHEMQHLMNFATKILYYDESGSQGADIYSDTWLDEGLSSAAEYIYSGEVNEGRLRDYNEDNSGFLSIGDNFFLWDNYKNIDESLVLNDYATVSLFFQWLRLHYGEGIYGDIFRSTYTDYRAITAATSVGWTKLFSDWHIANYVQDPSGIHGYKNDPVLKNVKAHYLRYIAENVYNLYPGEAVYSYAGDVQGTLPNGTGTLWYAGLSSSGYTNSNIPAGGALLSFNSDTNKKGALKSAAITGIAPPLASVNTANNSRSVSGAQPFSYRIDAGDLMGRDRFGRVTGMPGLKHLQIGPVSE